MRRKASLLLVAVLGVTALAVAAHGAGPQTGNVPRVVRKGFAATLDSLGHKLGRLLRWAAGG